MEKDIVDGKLGSVGGYDLEFKGGKLMFKLNVSWNGLAGEVAMGVDADGVLDALAKAIPGQIDDTVFALLKAALKA